MWFHFKNPTLRGNWIIFIKVIDKWPYVTNEAVLLVAADACKAEVKEIEKMSKRSHERYSYMSLLRMIMYMINQNMRARKYIDNGFEKMSK